MASKSQKKNKKARPSLPAGAEVERLLDKGRLKDAVREAKLHFRAENSEASRRLLERAYLLRAQQLQLDGMPTSAREVAQHLLELGVSDPALQEDAAKLFLAVGMIQESLALQEAFGSPETRERLLRDAADLAVIHPERDQGLPELAEGARQVRTALEALEAGDEAKAAEVLRDIARNSPYADWKLFARGLAAFFRRDAAEMRANWDRLDAGRAAARIAGRLMGLEAEPGSKASGVPDLGPLERRVFGAPILVPLRQLRGLVAEGRWDEALRVLAPLRFSLRAVDPELARRLTRILYDPLMQAALGVPFQEARRLVERWKNAAEPLPIDPHWNRLWAMLWEAQGAPEQAESYWTHYIKDLQTAPELTADTRALGEALIWKHMGDECLSEAESFLEETPFYGPSREELAETDENYVLAVKYFEESLKLRPDLRAAYRSLQTAYERLKRPDRAAAVLRRLLEVFPDDFDTLMELAKYHFGREEPEPTLAYATRARALKPLDQAAVASERAARLMLARHHALNGRFEQGRAEFGAVERLGASDEQDVHLTARKVAFELKAGQPDVADASLEAAKSTLTDATPLWLATLIEGRRYGLPKEKLDTFDELWNAGAAKKPKAETAGALARLVSSFESARVEYPGRAEHVRQVLEYVEKTTRLKYRLDDLRDVCAMLLLFPNEEPLFLKLINRGLKLFPDAAFFLMLAAEQEMKKPPFQANTERARAQADKALKAAEAASDPRDARLVPHIKQMLSVLSELTSVPTHLPFHFGRGTPDLDDLFELFGGPEIDSDFWDDEPDDGWDPDGPPAPLPARKPKAKRKGRKR